MKKYVLATILALFILPAQAGNFGIGASIGQADVDNLADGLPTVSEDNTDTAFKVYGTYSVNKNFGVEFGYLDYGDFKVDFGGQFLGITGKVDGFALFGAAVGKIPVGAKTTLFGKLGLARSDIDISATDGIIKVSDSETSNDLFYGVGAEFAVGQKVKIRVEYELFTDVGPSDSDSDIDIFSVGFTRSF